MESTKTKLIDEYRDYDSFLRIEVVERDRFISISITHGTTVLSFEVDTAEEVDELISSLKKAKEFIEVKNESKRID